ncbi:cilia- and flagella-associated protein 44 isoform X2 [Aethina tumida]|uniref:cilia- and flagella-associated protein 44 isoform X2 n=1 Tax=Aethina tumida TaxID=116153 RepID=UPI002148C7B0|nr:cilia- and flagella-associated protein 44 isoform X2 [Aethina tumida]
MSQTEDDADEIPKDAFDSTATPATETDFSGLESDVDPQQQQDFLDDLAKGLRWVIGDWGEEEEGAPPHRLEEESDVYDPDDYTSKPFFSKKCTIEPDILEFDFSYGYNCRKYCNLVIADVETAVWGSGNYVHFYNIESKEIWFKRSALGGGIGALKKNPNPEYPHLAIAESGNRPIIILYEWPEMNIFAVLRGGTERSYSNLDYSDNGMLLVSQGGEPDYNITVWNWPKRRILLRCKSYVNDVFRVKFSPYDQGLLTSCGVAHIKFWKIARTFTGLKLKGEVGRFGKTEYSDIMGICQMPDGKVISGCSWGNMLVWDDGLIKLEVMRTQRKSCHTKPVVQINYNGEEIWTVGMDGHVKVWWYETIDHADPPDDDRVVMVEPNLDFHAPGVMIMWLEKRNPSDPLNFEYIAQDGLGGLWKIDLNTEIEPLPPLQLYNCHGGPIADIAACPYDQFFVSLGTEGKFFLYNYVTRQRLFMYQFPANGRCMIWVPLEFHQYGDELIMGFDDGQLRVCILTLNGFYSTLQVVQVIKPHNKPVIQISINRKGTILVSAGEDFTIFIFQLQNINELLLLIPIGYMVTPDIVTHITWSIGVGEWTPEQAYEVLLGCKHGYMVEATLPQKPVSYTKTSYLLRITPKEKQFQSCKSQIRRDIIIRELELKKFAKLERKKKELERIKKDNPGIIIDEEVFLADSESEEDLGPLYFPPVPNDILWLMYTEYNTVWVSMSGYDAGYIYEFFIEIPDPKPIRFRMIEDADDIEIYSFVHSYKRQYLVFAMQDGSIRINRVNPLDYTDLTDYWQFPVHDNLNGFVPKMCFSYDEKYFFTCGHDGNIFSFLFQPADYEEKDYYTIQTPIPRDDPVPEVPDQAGHELLNLQEAIVKAEEDRINRVANNHKTKTRQTIATMQKNYMNILERNEKLLYSQRISEEELEIDPRITEYINSQMEAKTNLVKRKLAYEVEKSTIRLQKIKKFLIDPLDLFPIRVKGILSNDSVCSLRQHKLPSNLADIHQKIETRLLEEFDKGRPPERTVVAQKGTEIKREVKMEPEYFLLGMDESDIAKLGPRLNRMLTTYRKRIMKWKYRAIEWEVFNAKKPQPGVNHPDDEAAYEYAKATIGDYVLKTDENYRVPPHLKQTTTNKFRELLNCQQELFDEIHVFSEKVYKLRDFKYKTIDKIKKEEVILESIHGQIPEDLQQFSPQIVKYDESEFPERKFDIVVQFDDNISDDIELEEEVVDVYVDAVTGIDLWLQILPKRADYPPRYEDHFVLGDIVKRLTSVPDMPFEHLVTLSEMENVDTVFEREIRVWLLNKLLVRQNISVEHVNDLIASVDKSVAELNIELHFVLRRMNTMELHILFLNQELTILNKYEANEFVLEKKLRENNTAVMDRQDVIDNLTNRMVEIKASIDEAKVEMDRISTNFTQATHTHKFYDFLRKVFKKKYKPPRVRSDDDSSSESSSSSSEESEEDDTASIDSRDFNIIKLDLNVCPKGCEQSMYDYTVALRSERYAIEQKVREDERQMELLKKELDMQSKTLKQLESVLAESKKQLQDYLCEKQQVLNQIIRTAALRRDQIQLYNANTSVENIEDCLIMSKDTISALYRRVGELQKETLIEKNKHEVYIKHLLRMKRDFGHMEQRIKLVKQDIAYQMFTKFGKFVDINEIESNVIKSHLRANITDMAEICMKKMVHAVLVQDVDLKSIYNPKIAALMSLLKSLHLDYIKLLRSNTARSEVLRLLTITKNELNHDLDSQDNRQSKIAYVLVKNKNDDEELAKIRQVIRQQEEEIEDLKAEIKMLKTKGYPPYPKRDRQIVDKIESPKQARKELKEEAERIPTEIILPDTYVMSDAEELVAHLLEELLGDTEILAEKMSTERMAKNIVERIMKCISCDEIVKILVDSLPLHLTEEQLEMVEEIAEKISFVYDKPRIKYALETQEEKQEFALEIMDNIIDETMLVKGNASEVMARMISRMVEEVPFIHLVNQKCIEKLADTLGSKLSVEGIKNEVLPLAETLAKDHKEDIRTVVSAILVKVSGSGQAIAREQVENLIDDMLLEKGDVEEVMVGIIEKICMTFPVENLMHTESLTNIALSIQQKIERKQQAALKTVDKTVCISTTERMLLNKDIRAIFNAVLHNVYGVGLDYLYVLKHMEKEESIDEEEEENQEDTAEDEGKDKSEEEDGEELEMEGG